VQLFALTACERDGGSWFIIAKPSYHALDLSKVAYTGPVSPHRDAGIKFCNQVLLDIKDEIAYFDVPIK